MRNLLLALLMALAVPCFGGEAAPATDDPVLEKRVMALAEELRCLVCQNQTLADSHAELAIDLKNQVREKLRAGLSERQVIDYMVERYGDFVLYRPPLKATTVLLWAGPFLLLAAAVVLLVRRLRARAALVAQGPLDEAQRARAAALLGDGKEGRP
ncbi:MAG: cytochrome c-type biogenesis protein [Pseudomonadota bacterium]